MSSENNKKEDCFEKDSLENLILKTAKNDLYSSFSKKIILVHDNIFILKSIESLFKENNLNISAASTFKKVKNKFESAYLLIAKINDLNINDLIEVRKKYSLENLLILALSEKNLSQKINELKGVLSCSSNINEADLLKIAKIFTNPDPENHKKIFSIVVDPTIQSVRQDLEKNDILSASKKLNFLNKYFSSEEKVFDLIYKCFKFAQKKEIDFPGIQVTQPIKTTDNFFIIDESAGKSIKFLGTNFKKSGIKKFKNKKRAELELTALKTIEERNKFNKWGSLESREIKSPLLLSYYILNPEDEKEFYYVFMELIEGPTFYSILPQCESAEKKGNLFASLFKKAALYELNETMAILQQNPIDISEEYKTPVDFILKTKKNFINNLEVFFTKKYIEDKKWIIDEIDKSIEVLFETLPEIKTTQFFDFYFGNIIFELGDEKFSNIEKIEKVFLNNYSILEINSDISNFVKKTMRKIDYNRINCYTFFTHDFHSAYLNSGLSKEEKLPFVYHFFLWRKKAEMLKQANIDESFLENFLYIDSLIKKIESKTFNDDDLNMIKNECKDDLVIYEDTDNLMNFYASFSAFGSVLKKSIVFNKKNEDLAFKKMIELFNGDLDKRNVKNYLSNFFKKEKNNLQMSEKRMFIHSAYFSNEIINEDIYNHVSPEKIKEFVNYTNIFLAFDKNLKNSLNTIKNYFAESLSSLADVINDSEKNLKEKEKDLALEYIKSDQSKYFFENIKTEFFDDIKTKKYFLRFVSASKIKNFLNVMYKDISHLNYKTLFKKYLN